MQDRIQKAVKLQQQGRLQEAARIYNRILRTQPANVDCLQLLSVAEMQLGNYANSVVLLDRAIRLSPAQALFHSNRGIALKQLRRFEEAMVSFDRAIALNPDLAEAHCNRGNVLQEIGRHDDALASYDRALALKPDYLKALLNRGNILQQLDQFEAAIASYDRAIELNPSFAEAYSNRASALQEIKQFEAALQDFEKAIALNPDYADAHWNSALCLLRLGDFERGWSRYEWRTRKPEFLAAHRARFTGRQWHASEGLKGKTILLHGEQGFGDTIQFARYAPVVADLGARVIVSVSRPLERLLNMLRGIERVVSDPQSAGHCDFHSSLLSLPLAFGTTLATIPCADEPYIAADPSLVTKWEARLGERSKPRVGVMWSGGTASKIRNRSMRLSQFEVVLDDSIQFISLQKDVPEDDRDVLAESGSIAHFGDEQSDFADAAALIELVDLVVTVDTSIAHLAGAMGKETWVLLPYSCDWRWMEGRVDSPWYPRVKLFRQVTRGDWAEVLLRVKQELRHRREAHR